MEQRVYFNVFTRYNFSVQDTTHREIDANLPKLTYTAMVVNVNKNMEM